MNLYVFIWAVSSVGRALHSHCRDQRFDSATVHQVLFVAKNAFVEPLTKPYPMFEFPIYFAWHTLVNNSL